MEVQPGGCRVIFQENIARLFLEEDLDRNPHDLLESIFEKATEPEIDICSSGDSYHFGAE